MQSAGRRKQQKTKYGITGGGHSFSSPGGEFFEGGQLLMTPTPSTGGGSGRSAGDGLKTAILRADYSFDLWLGWGVAGLVAFLVAFGVLNQVQTALKRFNIGRYALRRGLSRRQPKSRI